ncbi:hypothetical protein GO491_07625 [Flavobacteriaceae bacterium Ap0902]|nr:hypothetical protein [Flavobacteriaceae bacterium Ap0902]
MNIFSFSAHFGTEKDCKNHFKTEKAKKNAKLKLVNELAELKMIINDVGLSENKNLQKITDYE